MVAPHRTPWLLSLLLIAACGTAPTPVATPPSPKQASVAAEPAPARLLATVTPTHYTLALTIVPSEAGFAGTTDIDVQLTEPRQTIWIHGQHLTVTEVTATAGGTTITGRWEQVDPAIGVARVVFATPLAVGPARLHFAYTAPFDQDLEGLYKVDVDADAYAFTQFEALAARKAFPCFDEPGWKTPFDVTLTTPSALGAFANTRALGSEDAGDGMTRTRFATTAPLPTYLVAWAIGPLDVVTTAIAPNAVRATPLPLRGLAPRGRGPELAFALEHTAAIIGAHEAWFGSPYPFDKLDIVAVPDFSAGAMENAGLVTFRDSILLVGSNAPANQRRGCIFTLAHELAHQWFGDLVTMAWWDDLWLNEAFASWAEIPVVQRLYPELRAPTAAATITTAAFDADSLATARRIRNPIASEADINNAFDAITYDKGSAVLAMIEHWLGDDVFQRGIQRYLHAHAGGSATADDLMGALAAESHSDVAAVMTTFLMQPGVPLVGATVDCSDAAHPRLRLHQQRYLPLGSGASQASWRIPVCARYHAAKSDHTTCTLLTASDAVVDLDGGACPDWLMPNAGKGYYRWTLDDAALARLRAPAALAALTVPEQISVADSVQAGFAAGTVSFAAALTALAPLARSSERRLAMAPIELLGFARDYLVADDTERAALDAYDRRLYAEQARRLGWAARSGVVEDDEQKLLRANILEHLALAADDPGVRREARRRGEAWVGFGVKELVGVVHPEAVSAELVTTALTVAVQEDGARFYDALDALLTTSQDAVIRGAVIVALASVHDPALSQRALGLALDPRLRENEVFVPLASQLRDRRTRDAAWTWLVAHYDAIALRLGPALSGFLPMFVDGFCSDASATTVDAELGPRMKLTQGGERNLAAAVESIALCSARAAAHRESAHAFFAKASKP